MRSLTFVKPGRLEFWEVAAPALGGDHEAVVAPVASTTCDLDRAIIAGATPFPAPFAIGHECVARVVEAGEDSGVRPDELVVVPWHPCCTECGHCRRGLFSHCERVARYTMYGAPLGAEMGGLFDDLVHVPFGRALVRVPAGVDPAVVASASDNLSDAYGAVSRALAPRSGASVLVIGGTGSIGQWAAGWSVLLGAARTVYVDGDAASGELARRYGAEAMASLDELAERATFDVLIDASGNAEHLRAALPRLAPGGHCHSVGIYFGAETGLPLGAMYMTGVSFSTGRPNVLGDLPHVLWPRRLRAHGPGPVFSDRVAYDDLPTVLAELPRKVVAVRDDAD